MNFCHRDIGIPSLNTFLVAVVFRCLRCLRILKFNTRWVRLLKSWSMRKLRIFTRGFNFSFINVFSSVPFFLSLRLVKFKLNKKN